MKPVLNSGKKNQAGSDDDPCFSPLTHQLKHHYFATFVLIWPSTSIQLLDRTSRSSAVWLRMKFNPRLLVQVGKVDGFSSRAPTGLLKLQTPIRTLGGPQFVHAKRRLFSREFDPVSQ
jgi:hypothetical protein